MSFLRNVAASISLCLIGFGAHADPVKLKFAFFSSDKGGAYTEVIKPFIDAVNAEAPGVVEIEGFPGGVLEPDPSRQADALLDGRADLALVSVGSGDARFGDAEVIELPGLFRTSREATATFTRMVEKGAIRGFEDFVVIAAVATEPHDLHTQMKITGLDDLKGLRLTVNADAGIESVIARALGMVPTEVPFYEISPALSAKRADVTSMTPSGLVDYGIARVAGTHYLLRSWSVPLAFLMSRKSYEALPPAGQAAIRKFSGSWMANRFTDYIDGRAAETLAQLRANKARQVIEPSAADAKRIEAAFARVAAEWERKRPENAALAAGVREVRMDVRGKNP